VKGLIVETSYEKRVDFIIIGFKIMDKAISTMTVRVRRKDFVLRLTQEQFLNREDTKRIKKQQAPVILFVSYPNIIHATSSVTKILKTCAMRNTAAGFFESLLKISANFVSSPMQVNANANQNI